MKAFIKGISKLLIIPLILALTISVVLPTPSLAKQPVCLPLKDMTYFMLVTRKQAYLSTFIDKSAAVFQLYVSRAGEWTLIGVTPELSACILLEGYDFRFAGGYQI